MGSFLRDLWVLYRRELRSALRERSIVVNGILIPILLYPILLWTLFTALTFVQGQAEGFVSRVVILDEEPWPELGAALGEREDVRIVQGLPGDSLDAMIGRGAIDAVVAFEAAPGGAVLPGNVAVRVAYDRSEGRSRSAIQRVDQTVDSLRAVRLAQEAAALGLDTVALRVFAVAAEDISTDEEGGRLFLAIILPLFLTLMVALGCFIPAVDATAGERERSTWETLWTTGASRGSIVLAKYLLVATIGALAGILNVGAISLSLGSVLAPLFGDQAEAMGIVLPLDAIPVMMAVAVLLALLFAALMMVLAVFARTFKEGQAMVVPAYYLALVPALLGSSPDRGLTPSVAFVPVANVALGLKDAIMGRDEPVLLMIAFLVNLGLVVACLVVARSLLLREEVVTGAFEGSLWSWIRKRRRA